MLLRDARAVRRVRRAVMSRPALAWRIAAVAALIAVYVVVQTQVGLPEGRELRSFFDDLGWIAPVVFIALYAAATVLLLPASLLTVAAGAVFGFWSGIVLVFIGAMIGATVAFSASRWLGRDSVEGISRARVRRLDKRIGEHGFLTVLIARLLPIIPFVTINYVFGLTAVTVRSYAIGTAVGIVPGTALYVAVGSYGFRPGSWPFIAAITGVVLLTIVGTVHARRSRQA